MNDYVDDRKPPHDLAAEQSVLGGMLLSARAAAEAADELTAEDFYQPRHGVIFASVSRLLAASQPTDVIAVTDALIEAGDLEKSGGADYLHSLTSIVPTAANAGYYASIVAKKAILRRLVEAGTRIAQYGFDATGDPAALAEKARSDIDAVSGATRAEAVTIGQDFMSWVESQEKAPEHVETPWRELNDMLGGFRPGRMYVIGARPGEGKSIMGLQIANKLATKGPVAFSSLEMSRDELLTRLVSMRGKIHMTPLTQHRLTQEQWQRVSTIHRDVSALPLFVDDRSGVTVTAIQSFARTVSRKGHLAAIVVDYLQLITGGDRSKARHEVVGEISRHLKIMAREFACPVIALSQLNRESVGKQRRAPTAADLRESGAIEQDADVVMLLQRQLEEDDQPGDRLNVHVAKNRHGRTGMRTLLWEGQFSRLTSTSWGLPPEFPSGEH